MKPQIEKTSFGAITVGGETYNHDIVIELDGRVRKRAKKLSKELYGTSHIISLAEIENVYQEGAQEILVGTGQFGRVNLSEEAEAFLAEKKCKATLLPTGKAMRAWNEAEDTLIGVFHITC